MSEEKISEFTRELTERGEPMPQDLIKKYRDLGVPESEIAAALLARQALAGPSVPDSALEKSKRRISELTKQSAARASNQAARSGLGARISQAVRRFLRIGGR